MFGIRLQEGERKKKGETNLRIRFAFPSTRPDTWSTGCRTLGRAGAYDVKLRLVPGFPSNDRWEVALVAPSDTWRAASIYIIWADQ